MLVLEVGLKLDKSLIYYHDMLIKNGLSLDFACVTHDIYYTDKNLDNLTEKEIIKNGYKKVFDTIKMDFQYCSDNMKSKIQLQDIKDIGLLVYYDNPDYYELPLKEQREKLIDELNSYGFNFKYNDLGLDKLRTLYYKKEMYSENQNS